MKKEGKKWEKEQRAVYGCETVDREEEEKGDWGGSASDLYVVLSGR